MRKLLQSQPPINWLLGFLVVICLQFFLSWIFVRFFHYKAQYRNLPKGSFTVEVITEADYQLLADRTLDKVELSNGTTIVHRSPEFYDLMLPNYVRSGDRYVLVTSLGTSLFYDRWLTDFLPLFFLSCIALVFAFLEQRRQFPLEKHNKPVSS